MTFAPLGRKRWAIAEGYIPKTSNGPAPELTSHEAICFLNTSDADVRISIFFTDREPVPTGTDYSVLIESSVPVVVQHTRLDSRQAENALMTTIAYSEA